MTTVVQGSERDIERLRAAFAIDETTGCWAWTRHLNRDGYGHIRIGGTKYRAHRAAYMLLVGPIPDGLVLDHLCRNRGCVNPEHLEPVTDEVNRMRGNGNDAKARRTGRCVNGHEYTPENTYVRPEGRQCRACARERQARSGRIQAGLKFTCPICSEQRHPGSKRRHLATHGVTA